MYFTWWNCYCYRSGILAFVFSEDHNLLLASIFLMLILAESKGSVFILFYLCSLVIVFLVIEYVLFVVFSYKFCRSWLSLISNDWAIWDWGCDGKYWWSHWYELSRIINFQNGIYCSTSFTISCQVFGILETKCFLLKKFWSLNWLKYPYVMIIFPP